MDNYIKEIRSYNMSRIRSTNSIPEEMVKNICSRKVCFIEKM